MRAKAAKSMAPTTAAVLKTFRFSSRFIVLVSPAKMGTGPSGSTITNKATVAFSRSRRNVSIEAIVSSFSSLVQSFLWWAGRDLNPRPSPCEGDVRSVQSSCLPGWTTGPTSRHWETTIFHLSKKTFDLLLLAEKPNIRALRILFDESR